MSKYVFHSSKYNIYPVQYICMDSLVLGLLLLNIADMRVANFNLFEFCRMYQLLLTIKR